MKMTEYELKQTLSMPNIGRGSLAKKIGVSETDARILVAIKDNRDLISSVLRKEEVKSIRKEVKSNKKKDRNILVIGDLHAPFTLSGYLEFCKKMYIKHSCNEVVFIGDLIDNHYSSYHETDPDGHSAAMELALAKSQIREWYETFPNAKVCTGNHDVIPSRKAMTSGVSKGWVKTIGEVLDTPNWEYSEDFIIDDVLYTHGVGRKARQRAKADLISVVQGHYHSEGYVEYLVGMNYKIFALQVGSGLDKTSYAAAYAKHFNKPHVCCGLVLENGTLPFLEYMNL